MVNKAAQKLAYLRAKKLTKEQRIAIARMGGKAGGRGRPKTPPPGKERAKMTEIEKARKEYLKADEKSKKWADKISALMVAGNVTRARITTLNAEWQRAAQLRDELKRQLVALESNTL
jgi:hypothetical protein